MPTFAPVLKKKEYPLVPAGTHLAILYKFMNLGTRLQQFQGKDKEYPDTLCNFTFEIPGELHKFTVKNDDDTETEVEKPLVLSREFTLSMGSKSNLRPFVEGIIGVKLSDEEAAGFNLESLLGQACLISVIHKKSADGSKTFANIVSTSPLIKGMAVPKQFNPTEIFDVNLATQEQINKLPLFLQGKITVSDEYKKRFLGITDETPELDKDEIPF